MAGRKLIVEVAADISQYVKGLNEAAGATKKLNVGVTELNVDTKKLTETAVRASVRRTERLEQEVAAYRQLAASAQKGSREQIAATNLATQAERKLAAELAVVGHEARSTSGHTKVLSRDLEHAARGALSGSGLFHSFGRSLAFASGGFLAFHEASDFLRESISAAREAAVAQRSLAAQMKASGESFDQNRERIDKVALSYGKFGFQNDEVIQSLTVLERGTGDINKAIGLQGLTADIARAKNIKLADAATVVAKVFGGQETALRRAVPGLEKNAHGWDLIRQAQAKLAGQAAANTTASERFAATLHDTQEIIGSALLPILNRYLDSLGKWLQHMNESGELQRDVNSAVKAFTDLVQTAKTFIDPLVGAFKELGDAVGGTKNELKLLAGVFITFKTVRIAESLIGIAGGIGRIGTAAEGSAAEVGALRTALLGPAGLIAGAGVALLYMQQQLQNAFTNAQQAATSTFQKGSGLETTLVPNLAKQIKAMEKAGQSGAQIIAALRKRLGGSLKADDLITEAFQFSTGTDPKLDARIRKQVRDRLDSATKTAQDEVKKHKPKPATVEQRNTWFDDMISRAIGAVSDTPTGAEAALPVQLQRLKVIAQRLQARIDATKDITHKQKLQDQLQQVINEEFQKQQQINDNAKQAADAAKQAAEKAAQAARDRADAAKAAADAARQEQVAWADVGIQRAQGTVSLQDNLKADRNKLRILEQQAQVGKMTAEKAAEILTVQQDITSTTQQIAINAKQQSVKTLQNKIDWAVFNLEKDDATKTLKDNIRDEKIIIGLIKQHIRLVGRNVSDARDLFQRQQELKDLLTSKKKTGGGGTVRRNPFGQQGYWVDDMFFATNVGGAGGGGGFVPVTSVGATATTRPFSGAGVNINNLNLHGVQNVRQLNDELVKVSNTRPQPRRGPS